jgi:4-amino-4-deoxy-L-arabinose transferase-like glycosyltransferase
MANLQSIALHDDMPAREQWRASRKICFAIGALFFLKFAAFGLFLTPLWDVPDESGHYSYVEDLSRGNLPLLGEARISRDVTDSWIRPGARQGRNWIAQHPPLYYALATPVALTVRAMGGSFEAQVRGVRVLTALIGAVGLVGLMAFLTLATGRGLLGLAAGIFVGATPMFTQLSSGVSHDPLVACTAAWACYWLVRWLHDNQLEHALYCAFLAGMCCLTKVTGLTMAIPLFLSMALWIARTEGLHGWRRGLLRSGVLWLVMFTPILLWAVRNWLHFHQLFPDAGLLHVYPDNPKEMGFFEYMWKYPVWQNVLLNFIALLGWMGSVPGTVVTVQANGAIARFFLAIFLFCSSFSIAHAFRPLCTPAYQRASVLVLAVACVLLAVALPTYRTATVACSAIFLAVAWSSLRNAPRALRSVEVGPWLMLTGCVCILFFSILYYQHIWGIYTQLGRVKALHGRYCYGVMPFLALLMAWPLRKGVLPIAAIAVATVALILSDGFFLHDAFVMYGLF